jgi:hypothetical protein
VSVTIVVIVTAAKITSDPIAVIVPTGNTLGATVAVAGVRVCLAFSARGDELSSRSFDSRPVPVSSIATLQPQKYSSSGY